MVVEQVVLAKNFIQWLERELEALHAHEQLLIRERVVYPIHWVPAVVLETAQNFVVNWVHFVESVAVVAQTNLHHKCGVVLVVREEHAKYEYVRQDGDHRVCLIHFAKHEEQRVVMALEVVCTYTFSALVG